MSGWNGRIGALRLDPFMNTPSKSSEAARPQRPHRNFRKALKAQALKRDDGHGRSQLVMA